MLKKVMGMLASKYLSIKTKMRAIEARLTIHSLLLRDKKIVRHFFHHRRHLNLSNTIEDGNYQSVNKGFTSTCSAEQLTGDNLEMKVDEDYELPPVVDGDDYKSNYFVTLVDNSFATAIPVGRVQLVEEKMEVEEDYEHLPFEDDLMKDESTSVIEIVKNAKERQGKEFKLEDNIDEAADLFIRRFHHQIRLHAQVPP